MAEGGTDVLIVGGGPVGLFLGCLLAARGVRFQILERRAQASEHSRAIGIHPPALRAFEGTGLTDALLTEGVPIRRGLVLGERGEVLGELPFAGASERYPFILSLPQRTTEALLRRRLEELAPGTLTRSAEVTGLRERAEHVEVEVNEGGQRRTLRARRLVGADGWRSRVRAQLGVPFSGATYPDKYLMGDFPDTTPFGPGAMLSMTRGGVVECFPLPGGGRRWVAHTGGTLRSGAAATDLAELIAARTGLRVPARDCTMISAFEVRHGLARRMVRGRVSLIGDAAHIVSPIGGQGMNLGWLDALELAPLLAGGEETPAAAWQRFERRRRRSAWLGARQAKFNMSMGRPISGRGQEARRVVLRGLLAGPTAPLLAQAFTMRWL